MRLDKYLSLAQAGTRKKVRACIYQGEVTVNGELVQIPAFEIDEKQDKVCFQGEEIQSIEKVCYMFYKPQGCITAKSDAACKTVFDYFSDIDTTGLFAVGRLDKNTEGLLLITNDGDLNHRLMAPEHHVEKTYYFWVFGRIDEEGIQKINQGMELEKGVQTSPAKIEITRRGLYSELKPQMEEEGCFAVKCNLHRQEVTAGYLTISEGRKHQVKRMMKKIGCYVVYLKRTAIGGIELDANLPKGAYRRIESQEQLLC